MESLKNEYEKFLVLDRAGGPKTKIIIYLEGLPIVSLNKFYSGIHWAQRKKIKDQYYWLIKEKTNKTFNKPCGVDYLFAFKGRILDCSNCVGMVKMIEDVLFPDDSHKIVKSISVQTQKDEKNYVKIIIKEDV